MNARVDVALSTHLRRLVEVYGGQHLHALDHSDRDVEVVYRNTHDDCPNPMAAYGKAVKMPDCLKREHFDAVILHYTFLAFHWDALALLSWKQCFQWIADLPFLKVAMPQDEADHAELLDEWLFEWGVDVVFSVIDQPQAGLYPQTRRYAQVVPCLTGYIDEMAVPNIQRGLLPTEACRNDLVYRARNLPFNGTAGRLKARLGEHTARLASATGLAVDISTRAEDAILGPSWLEFLASSKAALGCESGFSVVDQRGEIKSKEAEILAEMPEVSFAEFGKRMPPGWDNHRLFTISPRHFEAAMTKTCQVLIEGHYEGIFCPDVHYIPLKADFCNLSEVLRKLHDVAYLRDIAEAAYTDVVLSGKHTYREFGNRVYDVLASQLTARDGAGAKAANKSQSQVRLAERKLTRERHVAELQTRLKRQKFELFQTYRSELARESESAKRAALECIASCDYIAKDIESMLPYFGEADLASNLLGRVEEFRGRASDLESLAMQCDRACGQAGASLDGLESIGSIDGLIQEYGKQITRLNADNEELIRMRELLIGDAKVSLRAANYERVRIDQVNALRNYRRELSRQTSTAKGAVLDYLKSCDYLESDMAWMLPYLKDVSPVTELQRGVEDFRAAVHAFAVRSKERLQAEADHEDGGELLLSDDLDRLIKSYADRVRHISNDREDIEDRRSSLIGKMQALMEIAVAEQARRSKVDVLQSYRRQLDQQALVAEQTVQDHLNSCSYLEKDIGFMIPYIADIGPTTELRGNVEHYRSVVREFELWVNEWFRDFHAADLARAEVSSVEIIDRLIASYSTQLKQMNDRYDEMSELRTSLIEQIKPLMTMAVGEKKRQEKISALEVYRVEVERLLSSAAQRVQAELKSCEYVEHDVKSVSYIFGDDPRPADLLHSVSEFRASLFEFEARTRSWCQQIKDMEAQSIDVSSVDNINRLVELYVTQLRQINDDYDAIARTHAVLNQRNKQLSEIASFAQDQGQVVKTMR